MCRVEGGVVQKPKADIGSYVWRSAGLYIGFEACRVCYNVGLSIQVGQFSDGGSLEILAG